MNSWNLSAGEIDRQEAPSGNSLPQESYLESSLESSLLLVGKF